MCLLRKPFNVKGKSTGKLDNILPLIKVNRITT